jgi:hypothetical protein
MISQLQRIVVRGKAVQVQLLGKNYGVLHRLRVTFKRFIVSSGALNLIRQFLDKSALVSKTAPYAGRMLP